MEREVVVADERLPFPGRRARLRTDGFVAPPNKTLLLLANGLVARLGYRKAIAEGRDRILGHADKTLGN
jgi:hypothetical protein